MITMITMVELANTSSRWHNYSSFCGENIKIYSLGNLEKYYTVLLLLSCVLDLQNNVIFKVFYYCKHLPHKVQSDKVTEVW